MCKLLHYTWSLKAMILLLYASWNDFNSLLTDMQIQHAEYYMQDLVDSVYCHEGGDFTIYYECEEPLSGTKSPPKVVPICADAYANSPLFWIGRVMIIIGSIYAVLVFLYGFIKSPKFGTLDYYAYMVMMKRMKFFKRFVKIMYVLIVLQVLLWFCVFFLLMLYDGQVLTGIIQAVAATIIISGIAVSELRTTNEINFKYEMPETDQKYIYLKSTCCCCCTLVTAEQMFERLEEAVSYCSITDNNRLLKEILREDTDDECERVMNYYRTIYQQKPDSEGKEKVIKSHTVEMIKNAATVIQS
eukprot:79461_1